MIINCLCSKSIKLNLVGGQYQDTYTGRCQCGRIWSLEEKSQELKELNGKQNDNT